MGKNRKRQFDLVVIGGGAAGMTAAITAARKQKKVCILEKTEKLGKKLFATGNGKCNFTNERMQAECFGAEGTFVSSILETFSVQDCLAFFRSIGIYPKNKNGYYYPNSEQAASVVTALVQELKRLEVFLCCETTVHQISVFTDSVSVETDKGTFVSSALVIATGLLASPKLGSDGSLFPLIESLGHRFSPVLPALCGFYCKGIPFKKIGGVRVHGTVKAVVNGQITAQDTGEIQFTDYGLSGIPVFQISRYLSKSIYEKNKTEICLNLLPDLDSDMLLEELIYRTSILGEERVAYLCNGLLNQKLSDMILEKIHLDADTLIFSLSRQQLENIVYCIQNLTVKVTNYRDYEFAQVCTGGIALSEIYPHTLESKLANRVYFAGEVLDVDGICGGYNLHFAWASGHLAGKSAGERIV